jgi:transcriptional regulator with XRE-family HTH domain
MKQPELGRKLLELRKQKGLTQEELVEQCNINVRTIQRIEAGEVTPRSFTLKTILNVLDEDLESLEDSGSFNLKDSRFSLIYIRLAWICGIIYLLSGFVEYAVDYARFYEDELILPNAAYISMKFIVLLAFIYFLWGFVLSGKIFNNYLLKIGAFFLIGTTILFYGYDMVSLYFEPFYTEYVQIAQSIFYGIGSIVFGLALMRLKNPFGKIPEIAGGFEIVSGILFTMVFMGWLGLAFLFVSLILQIILLYKIEEMLKKENNLESA